MKEKTAQELQDQQNEINEQLLDRLEEEKKARAEFQEKILTKLDEWKSKINDPEVRAAGDATVDEHIRKVTPIATDVRYRGGMHRGYRALSLDPVKKEGIYHWAIGFLTQDKQRQAYAYEKFGLTMPRNPGNPGGMTKTDLAGGTVGSGAEFVPEEWVAEIMKIAEEQAAYRPRARIRTTTTDTVHLSARNAPPTVVWVAEAGAAGTGGEPTYSQIDATVKKNLSIYTTSTELLEDANVDVVDDVNEQLAEAIAKEDDRIGFEGDISGLTDPFDGLRFTTGLEELSIGDTIAFTVSHLRQAIAKLETRELAGAWWYMHPIELVFMMGIEDSQNRPLWLPGNIAGGAPPTLFGYPYATTDVILRTRLDVVADKSSLYFGNLIHSTFIDRTGVAIDQSRDSKFATDQIDIRLRRRTAYAVHFPSALVRIIDFDTSTNAP